jgi:uncharacterized membrane protein
MKLSYLILAALTAFAFLFSIYYYPQLPDQLVSHWDGQGEPNGYLDKDISLFLLPAMMAGFAILFSVIPRIDPLKKNIADFRIYFDIFVILLFIFLACIHMVTIYWNLGFEIPIIPVIAIWIAVLFYYSGLLMKKSKRNWFIGIRTPWTLSSDRIWEKTNGMGGTFFQVAGFLMLFGMLLGELIFLLLVILMISIGFAIAYYSYSEYQKEQKEKKLKA